jgi:hypothetical protein
VRSVPFLVGGAAVVATAPERVLTALEQMLARLARPATSDAPDLQVSAQSTAMNWTVTVETPPPTRLSVQRNALPAQIAGTMVSAMVAALSARDSVALLRGAVVAKDGKALALRGRNWRELFVLTAHLSARGWGIVGGAAAFLEPGNTVRSLHKLLYCDALALDRVPRSYRGALEVSPWYVRNREIFYYAVDPASAFGARIWCDSAQLAGILDVTAGGTAAPLLNTSTVPAAAACVHGTLTSGAPIGTADAVDRWWEGVLASPVQTA